MSYHVRTDAFHGPLDLLLHLVRKQEVDVLDVPIAALADQFLAYLTVARELDVELAGDFLVMAATLMEIKSRTLVPSDPLPETDVGPDPRKELVKQLLEYRRFKDAAQALEKRAEEQATQQGRIQPEEPSTSPATAVRSVELWDLVAAFARLVRETQSAAPQTVVIDDTPQHVYEAHVREAVRTAGRVAFAAVFTPPHHRTRLIGLLLALLELIKRWEVCVEQPEAFGELWLTVPVKVG